MNGEKDICPLNGEPISVYEIARNITEGQFADLLEDFLNNYNGDYTKGQRIGRMLHRTHRTLQGSAIRFALGIIVALGEQEYTDARNEKGVALGKKLKTMLDNDELDMGYMI